MADHARLLQRRLLGRRQAIDARLQDAGERRRHADVEKLVGGNAPRLAVGDDDAVVDEHADQLLDEVRVAFGAAREQVAQRHRHRLEAAQQRLDQLARAALGERREIDAQVLAAAAAPEGAALVERRARHAEQEQRQVAAVQDQMVDEIERAFVGPVQVVEQEDDRRARVAMQCAEIRRERVEGPIADLLRFAGDGDDVRVAAVLEADQLADQRGVLGGALAEHGAEPGGELVLGDRLGVALEDLEARGEHVAQQAVGNVVAVRMRPALEEAHRLALQLEPVRELEAEAALADAGLADDRHLLQALVLARTLERLADPRQLRVAADHLRLDPLQAAVGHAEGTRLGTRHEVAAHRAGDALDLDRRLRFDVEDAAHVSVRLVADPQGAGGSGLLHARGDVDADAANASFGVDAAAEEHRAGVDADAQVEAVEPVARATAGRERRRLGDDREAGADRALGVVLEGLVGAEHRQQAVAGVLEDAPLVGANDRRQALEGAVHHRVDVFRVEALGELGRADDVHEEHGGGLQLLRRPFALAPRGELFLQRRDRHGDDGVAEERALGLQRGDGRFDLLRGVFHASCRCACDAPASRNSDGRRRLPP